MTLTVASPCVGLCRIEPLSNLCLGCARTLNEVVGWAAGTEAARREVWANLPGRRERLGIGVHRLAWTMEDIHAFIARTLAPGGGTWVSGLYGAVAEFCIGQTDRLEVDVTETMLTAVTPLGAIRFTVSHQVRVFGFGGTHRTDAAGAIVLAVPASAATAERHVGLTSMGRDTAALTATGRKEVLYDLGIGSAAARFAIRTGCADVMAALDAQRGQPWSRILAALGGVLVHASPTRVVQNTLGRIEVYSAIPPPGGVSPNGPHTHLLPAHLAAGGDLPPGLQIPEGFMACAIHYPGPQPENE